MSQSWIWQEATRLDEHTKHKDVITFATGFGPSSIPHIGTFAEIARTNMVRKAFEKLTGKKTRLIVFSDDMDALRKVPDNVPKKRMLAKHLGRSLSAIPDPFGKASSFAEHNNRKLLNFLDQCEFDYEFISSTECYEIWKFYHPLYLIAKSAKEIAEIVTHDYGSDRKATYCPFIPIDSITGQHQFDLADWEIEFIGPGDIPHLRYNSDQQTEIYNGNVKCQWKVDWPMRWIAFDVDYEMHGKDLIGSAQVGQRICKALGQRAPLNYMFELFLDEDGQKISKSVGNGLEFEDWIKYAPIESLLWFLFGNPRKSRKLFWGMVPATVDRFIDDLKSDTTKPDQNGSIWAVYGDDAPEAPAISYQMLLNLVNITNTNDPKVLWEYIKNYAPKAHPGENLLLDSMTKCAIKYYKDHIAPNKNYRDPSTQDREVLLALADRLEVTYKDAGDRVGVDLAEYLMNVAIYEVGKEIFGNDRDSLRKNYFMMLYQVLMGQDTGPRFGQFAVAYGVENTIALLRKKANT